jgi:PIN domain nuclease of toxin-antitoxin system
MSGGAATPVRVSAASVWELILKHHQGKLPELSGTIADLPGLLQADDRVLLRLCCPDRPPAADRP